MNSLVRYRRERLTWFDCKDSEGFDRLESTKRPIDERKFLLNRLYVKQPIPQD